MIMKLTKMAPALAWSTLFLASSAWSQSQADLNVKAQRSFDAADVMMSQQWKAAYDAMKQMDAAYQASGNDFKFAETALDSQRAWLHLRDQQCSIESAIFKGGSMAPMVGIQCQERMTKERTEDLKALLAQTR